jgi:hypothetical protein
MADQVEAPPADESLARLLEVERGLEARVRDAEAAARSRVDAARESARRAAQERGAGFAAVARAEEKADLERHAAALRDIDAQRNARLALLAGICGETLETLAQRAVAIVLGSAGARSP